ncbi:type II secretion system GspH family protein [Patescibacteria group bacterium]|nr:type II secretion system GspH family protein [Patescibacteria group bacterium]
MIKAKGFTLVEILVVIAIVAIMGTILAAIFVNTLKGSNKSQILAVIKQNGQAVLENMDKTIREADKVVCLDKNTLVVVKNGCYTRYKFMTPSETQNGQIQEDYPQPDPSTPCVQNSPAPTPSDIKTFTDNVCTDPMVNPSVLTDTNPQSGVSVNNGSFTPEPQPGFKNSVTVTFTLGPGVGAPAAITGQIDPVEFTTSIGLR